MLHTIIYDNRIEGGFAFYERTPDFPGERLQEIAAVCNQFSEITSDRPAIRYQPLQNKMYLLSVVNRVIAEEHQHRRHFRIVHFLMDHAGATDFFSIPFCSETLYQYAEQCYQDRLNSLGRSWYSYLSNAQRPQDEPHLSPRTLCACYLQPRLQTFIGSPYCPDADISYLLNILPHALRFQLSFTIGMEISAECSGCTFNFSSAENIQRMQSTGYDGCQGTYKYSQILQDDQVVSVGAPDPTALAQADTFLTLLTAKTYPALRYLIKTRDGLMKACSASSLTEILKEYESKDIAAAIGSAKSNGELSEDGERALIKANPRKNPKKPKKPNKPSHSTSGPVPNPGRGNTAGANQTPPRTTLPAPDYGDDTMELGGNVSGFYESLEDPIDTPTNHAASNGGSRKPHSHTPDKPADNSRLFRILWLVIAIMSMLLFVFIQCLVSKLGSNPNAILGIFVLTIDGATSLLSTYGSFFCGCIMVYGLLQFFILKKK